MTPMVRDIIVRYARAAGQVGRQTCREHLRLLSVCRSREVRDYIMRISCALHALTMPTSDQIYVLSELVGHQSWDKALKPAGSAIAQVVEEIDQVAMTPQEAANDPRR